MSAWTSLMPATSALVGAVARPRRAAASARSRLSIAGSSSFASLTTPRVLRGRRLARRALAVVLEVGLRALRQLEVLVGLGGLRGSSSASVLRAPRRRSGVLLVLERLDRLGVAAAHLRVVRRSRPGASGGLGAAPSSRPLGAPRRRAVVVCRHRLLALVDNLGVDHVLLLGAAPFAPAPSVAAPSVCDAAAACSWARWYIASETLWKDAFSASVLALISAASSDVSESRTALIAASISSLEEASTVSPSSFSWRSAW